MHRRAIALPPVAVLELAASALAKCFKFYIKVILCDGHGSYPVCGEVLCHSPSKCQVWLHSRATSTRQF